jgi:uncharacterized protein
MDFTGSQKIASPRSVVFQSLLNPEVLKNSIPGCESAEFVDFPSGRQLKLAISPNIPGLKGTHEIFLQTGEVIPNERVVLITEPSSSLGTIKAKCTVDLTNDADGTLLNYNAQAEMEGKVAAIPDMIVKGAVKAALDHFFKNFQKQVSSIPA